MSIPIRSVALVVLSGLLASASAPAATLHVPAEYPTIQSCIDAAVSGQDECVVAPGTYNELLNFLGKAIALRSSHGPEVTTIDGTGLNGSVVTCDNSEGENTLLDSFTITGGTGTEDSSSNTRGGGMLNIGSSPTVTNCTFNHNSATLGGGMYNDACSPTVRHCTFANNEARDGGAISNSQSDIRISDSTFRDNNARSAGAIRDIEGRLDVVRCSFERNTGIDKYFGGGGAIFLDDSEGRIRESRFDENAGTSGGAIAFRGASFGEVLRSVFARNVAGGSAYGGSGGGISISSEGSVSVVRCDFWDNRSDYDGGALASFSSNSTVLNCRFGRNQAKRAGAVLVERSAPVLVNCQFSENSADYGGALYLGESNAKVVNCTVLGNSATYDAGGVYVVRGDPVIANSIVWGNRDWSGSGESAQVYDSTFPERAWYPTFSCIQSLHAFAGHGNTGENPRIVDPLGLDGLGGTEDDNLGLLPGSPCIDAGDNTLVPHDAFDLDGDANLSEPIPVDLGEGPRFLDEPCILDSGQPDLEFPALAIVDMGGFERSADSAADPDGDGLTNCDDNCPMHVNPVQADCDSDGVGDACVLSYCVDDPACRDCNANGVPDACDITGGAVDADGNGKPDACQRVWHVDGDAALGGNGYSWLTAFRYLQDAMHRATLGDEIRVAGGGQLPDLDEGGFVEFGSRHATFRLIDGVALRGAYRGCPEGDCSGGDPNALDQISDPTVLWGIVGFEDPAKEAWALHVVTAIGTGAMTSFEGFRISNADSDGAEWPDDRGAGMFIYHASLAIANCEIRYNRSNAGGGGVYAYRSSSIFENSFFRRNSGGDRGGALGNFYSNTIVRNCVFEENDSRQGGAMHNDNSSPTIVDSMFYKNSALWDGGAIYSYESDTVMQGCTISRNVTDPSSAGQGGGVYNELGNMTMERCVIARNVAAGAGPSYGGGLHNDSQGNLTMDRCIVAGNSAKYGGGIAGFNSTSSLANSLVVGNRGLTAGGATYFSSGSFVHSTFAANMAPTGAIMGRPLSGTFDHCILADPKSEPWLDGGSEPVVRYSLVEDVTPLDGIVFPGPGNIDQHAVFVRAPAAGGNGFGDNPITGADESANDDYGDLRLMPASPGVNAGDPNFAPGPGETDLDGHARVLCGRVDMGAYEFGIGDFDCDQSITLTDWAAVESCSTNLGTPYAPGCEALDFEYDGDVDLLDLAAWQNLLGN